MVYRYLLDLYQLLDERKKNIELELSREADASENAHYQRGRLTVIREFKQHLQENYHQKLPRRLRNHLK